MSSKPALLSLCLILVVLAAGCGQDKKKADAAAAKEWEKSTPPPAYLEHMKGLTGPPVVHPGPPAGGAAPK